MTEKKDNLSDVLSSLKEVMSKNENRMNSDQHRHNASRQNAHPSSDDIVIGSEYAKNAARDMSRTFEAMSKHETDGGKTLEMFVGDLVQPYLRQWLKQWINDNLPIIARQVVEELVRRALSQQDK